MVLIPQVTGHTSSDLLRKQIRIQGKGSDEIVLVHRSLNDVHSALCEGLHLTLYLLHHSSLTLTNT